MSAPSLIQRILDFDAGVVEDVLFEALQGVRQRGAGQSEVIADLVDLGDDFVAILLAHADVIHDLARGHGDLGGIDAVGAKHRATPTLRALMEVAVPVVSTSSVKSSAPTKLGKELAGQA
jgi:hypothetical protein